jgi:hypothetical protein
MREKPTNTPINNIIGVFVGFSRIFLLGILIFKGLTARRLYMSFGVKGLITFIVRGKTRCFLMLQQVVHVLTTGL